MDCSTVIKVKIPVSPDKVPLIMGSDAMCMSQGVLYVVTPARDCIEIAGNFDDVWAATVRFHEKMKQ